MTLQPPTGKALTPLRFLRRSATVFASRTAVIDGAERYTYQQFWDRVRRQAGLLRELGIKPGDRVAVLAPNSRLLLEAHFGVPLAGAVLVAMNTRLLAAELGYIAEHSGASVLLYDASLAQPASQMPMRIRLDSVEYERQLAAARPFESDVNAENSLISLNYTSGTTGRPKGVMYHHRGAYLQALAMAYHARLGPSSVHLWTLPMFHCNGWAFPWAVTAAGGSHVCLPKVVPEVIWELIEEEGVTGLNAAPTVLIDMAESPAAAHLDREVQIGTGGAPPSPTLLARLEGLGFNVTHLYGLTETFGPSVICEFPDEWRVLPPEQQARIKARQGNANISGMPLRVVDENGADVAPDGNQMGEVLVTGDTIALGYYRDPEATAQTFRSGWLHTGDLGVMHPDGYIELRDRAKDIIISGGENIASIEIEQALAQHPAVKEVAVVAGPHPRWGEVPHAYVTLNPGATVTEDELIVFGRQFLPGFKAPKKVVFGDLPKTSTGKIQKFALRSAAQLSATDQEHPA